MHTPPEFNNARQRPRERLAWAGITAQRDCCRETNLRWRRRQKQMRWISR